MEDNKYKSKELDPKVAKERAKHFKKIKKDTCAWVKYDYAEFMRMLNSYPAATEVKLIYAAYPDGDKRDARTVLIQLKIPGIRNEYVYFDAPANLCPPPDSPPCDADSELEN